MMRPAPLEGGLAPQVAGGREPFDSALAAGFQRGAFLRLLYVWVLGLLAFLFSFNAAIPETSCLPAGFRFNGGVWLRTLDAFDPDLNKYWQDVFIADVASPYERRCNGLED